jgi:hypothetical protein
MTPGRTSARAMQHIAALTGGSTLVVIDCRTKIGQPLALSEEALWDAIDTLLAEGLLEPAQQRGVRVRLTAEGAAWCRTLPRRLHLLHRVLAAREARRVPPTECRVAAFA